MLPEKFLSPYKSKEVEKGIYERWEKSGYFNPDKCIEDNICEKDAEHYSIVLPPPNVTGHLHLGHACMIAIQDIYVRYARMKGKRTLWIPGTDHAAIATQAVVEKRLAKEEKKRKEDVGRAEFMKMVKAFADDSHKNITSQVKAMGASVDWSREAYTLDEDRTSAVYKAFGDMYAEGLIYRGNRIVNWDPKLGTTVSDDEVNREEKNDNFYYLKYGPFTIGTSRPETKFGDKYVVMHPDDARYKKYKHGEKIEVDWINGKITSTIIKDEAVDPEFGTGVMTITPWHDLTDFEIAERHSLDYEQIIDFKGKLLPISGEFEGLHIKKARPLIIEKLKGLGLLEKVDDKYLHNIAVSDRSGELIEPQIKKQWFVDVNRPFAIKNSKIDGIKSGDLITLKDLMREVISSGQIEIVPGRFEKNYYHWIDNLKDWCISRQIWFGHRIPVWYKENEIKISKETPGDGWEQDPDTLDTWFSSGLWTFSTLGWPKETEDFKGYHPTSMLETGYDILFFWVARMVLMTGFCIGDIPFRTIYLHGLVLDGNGKKMSKSKGNVIDPLDMCEEYGADATRNALIAGLTPGNDQRISEVKIKSFKHFANKIWNISRFVIQNTGEHVIQDVSSMNKEDQKLYQEVQDLATEVETNIAEHKIHLASEKLYKYIWHRFADVVIEDSKPIIEKQDESTISRVSLLNHILRDSLKMLHPFMPFVTEEIWSAFSHRDSDTLMVAKWPGALISCVTIKIYKIIYKNET